MGYSAWFQCIKGCSEKYPLDDVIYQCRNCGALLEVVHDMGELKKKSAREWMDTFDDRIHKNLWPYGSGVWGKKELICPNIDNENVVSLYEGNTNLFWAERFGKDIGLENLWIKMCGNSHSGSFKDLGMTVLVSMVKQMIANGKKINAVACASTGDTSAALATYCAAAGIQSIVFLPKGKVSIAQLIQPIANGSLVLSIETDFDGCMEIVQKICSDHNIYLANSMNSLRIEGQKTISIEIAQQFDWNVPDVIIIPGGNLGNVSALGKGFLMLKDLGIIDKLPRIVVAQAEMANPLYLSYKTGFKEFKPIVARQTLANAIQIGNPVSYEKAIKTLKLFNGIVEQATEDELSNAAAKGDKYGMFNCPHTGVALAVLFKLLKSGEIDSKEKVVVISTAHGLKFTDFKKDYHEGKIEGVQSRYANLPVQLPADIDKIKGVIYERIEKEGRN
ncbi:MAG: threonine synthase [Nitrospinae bacterium]|nr:threonine synthase [Nitrospinota bacterium]